MKRGADISNIIGAFLLFGIAVAAVVGYVWNIVKLFSAESAGEIAGRIIGIVVGPVGCIAGWF